MDRASVELRDAGVKLVLRHTFWEVESAAVKSSRVRALTDPLDACRFADSDTESVTSKTTSAGSDEEGDAESESGASSEGERAAVPESPRMQWADVEFEAAPAPLSKPPGAFTVPKQPAPVCCWVQVNNSTIPVWGYQMMVGNASPVAQWAEPAGPLAQPELPKTTLIIKNLPLSLTRAGLLNLLDGEGLRGQYDFVYLPTSFRSWEGCGYAFVNMVDHDAAETAIARFQGMETEESKTLEVCWSEMLQGLDAHVERYRNSPVMHADVPDEYRPLLLQAGVSIPFPEPTQKIKAPRLRRSTAASK
jgi:hypothetical protein